MESYGIPTINLSINLEISRRLLAPRTVFVRFPHGASFGEPHQRDQQLTILRHMFQQARELRQTGQIVELAYRWRRHQYEPVQMDSFRI